MLCHDIVVMNQSNDVYSMAQDLDIVKFFTGQNKKKISLLFIFSQIISTEEYKGSTTRNQDF